ncbi:hypothetical protein JTB14_014280 [Gonioctena quinquepunctata]|nr:hypothetical protein JTB14_014280 [Gonioctena quinquepunctata]
MDNHDHEKEQDRERRNSNTEYLPTKCRITKPIPPKPATNPLQFIKVAPCPLFQKAHEQIKKVEEIKKEEKEMRTEVEDWQQNLDNWKSSRRKRQEHIIERVVEVKKLTEQEEMEKSRRKSKTFSEMMGERRRGRHKFNIPLYDDDSNDLSDYGIGSSSSKTNSIKDVDTDDSCSILDEKDNHSLDSSSNRENSSASNQSQSEDETNSTQKESKSINNNNTICTKTFTSTYTTSIVSNKTKPEIMSKPVSVFETKSYTEPKEKQYTYEGAIQDYRSRIQTINSDDSARQKSKEVVDIALPKGEIFKRKGLFENKNIEVAHLESTTSRRLSEDFANARTIKDRLRSLGQSTDQSLKPTDKSEVQISVKQRLLNFNKQNDSDTTNNNAAKANTNKISNYLLDKSSSASSFETKKTPAWKNEVSDRCFSPDTELYVSKLNMFNRDLDNLMMNNSVDENYAPSVSSTEFTGVSSDREDSGIHTADVSCSVSQADEPTDTETEILSSINERLNEETLTQFEKDISQFQADMDQFQIRSTRIENNNPEKEITPIEEEHSPVFPKQMFVDSTNQLLKSLRKDSSENLSDTQPTVRKEEVEEKRPVVLSTLPIPKPKPVIYENVEFRQFSPVVDFITTDFVLNSQFTGFIPNIEPPKVKPPPPPPPKEEEESLPDTMKRENSTRRIKKEIHIKRSSFLGLDEPIGDAEIVLEKPPELNSFFQREAKLEKSLYRKIQGENQGGPLSKVESQDSGLDIDRGRLSSDTWCSSVGDSSVPSHERQASEQTNSITSEEDEITKKEREIIELVEKEEQFRDTTEYVNEEASDTRFNSEKDSAYEPSLGSEQFNRPYFHEQTSDFLEEDSEVLKVEQELRQLELEELERQCDNLLFQESRAKIHLQNNRHSLENIYDKMNHDYSYESPSDCRKSMPELARQDVRKDVLLRAPLTPYYGYENIPKVDRRKAYQSSSSGNLLEADLGIPLDHRKSMPELQHTYQKSSLEPRRPLVEPLVPINHRQSMPELQHDRHHSAFKTPRPSIIPGRPLRSAKEWSVFDQQSNKPIPRQLGAVPRTRQEKWIQPKANPEGRNYNQHWVIQEAELRRISDRQKNMVPNMNWQQPRPRTQNRPNTTERVPPAARPDGSYNKELLQHSYMSHPQIMNHASPTMTYSPPMVVEETQDRILSVSGKKKCSYCGNELGRGAAMIIESLCLFYHMECFKCCVCHVQLGDGLMGTDVRVRNEKLHCHNCYSSDDGIKFSCV